MERKPLAAAQTNREYEKFEPSTEWAREDEFDTLIVNLPGFSPPFSLLSFICISSIINMYPNHGKFLPFKVPKIYGDIYKMQTFALIKCGFSILSSSCKMLLQCSKVRVQPFYNVFEMPNLHFIKYRSLNEGLIIYIYIYI